jgi:hypothetical protein
MSSPRTATLKASQLKAGDTLAIWDSEDDDWELYPVTAVSVEIGGAVFNPQEFIRVAFTNPDGSPNTLDYNPLMPVEVVMP